MRKCVGPDNYDIVGRTTDDLVGHIWNFGVERRQAGLAANTTGTGDIAIVTVIRHNAWILIVMERRNIVIDAE